MAKIKIGGPALPNVMTSKLLDPDSLGDPIALETEWEGVNEGGLNIASHKLVEVSHYRVEFRSTVKVRVVYGVFIAIGLYICISSNSVFSGSVLCGAVFIGVGVLLLFFGSVPFAFDKQLGYFWKGRKDPDEEEKKGSNKTLGRLLDAHAIQLLHKSIRNSGRSSRTDSNELNIVMKDGSRINVLDHGDRPKLLEDAEKLSEFLVQVGWIKHFW